MKILITGGAGYIGSVCLRHMVAEGHEVLAYDNLSQGHAPSVSARHHRPSPCRPSPPGGPLAEAEDTARLGAIPYRHPPDRRHGPGLAQGASERLQNIVMDRTGQD